MNLCQQTYPHKHEKKNFDFTYGKIIKYTIYNLTLVTEHTIPCSYILNTYKKLHWNKILK